MFEMRSPGLTTGMQAIGIQTLEMTTAAVIEVKVMMGHRKDECGRVTTCSNNKHNQPLSGRVHLISCIGGSGDLLTLFVGQLRRLLHLKGRTESHR